MVAIAIAYPEMRLSAGRSGPDRRLTSNPARAFPQCRICAGAGACRALSFILFSLSRFQLPHYLNILFPFFSILTAGWLYGIRRKANQQFVRIVQGLINIILPLLVLALAWFFHFRQEPLLLAGILFLSLLPFLLFRGTPLPVSITRSFWLALLAFSFVNFVLYPAILRYQAGTQAGRWIGRTQPAAAAVYLLQEAPVNYSIEFYSPVPVRRIPLDSLAGATAAGPVLVFGPASYADTLTRHGFHAGILQSFPNFHISQLTGEFLNARTRARVVGNYVVWRVSD